MKKFKKAKSLLFGFIFVIVFCFTNTNVYAKTMTPDEIQGPAYVIGSHVFTREINENTGYQGRLTTNLIMLASQTIQSSDLDSMIIYYKTASGMWINGLTGNQIETPESFEINYTNMQLEEENNTVSAPKAPILTIDGPLSINDETDLMLYQLNIFIDDIDDKSNKVDGVELVIVDYNSNYTSKEISKEELSKGITTVLDNYKGDALEIGKQYHFVNDFFECPPDGIYTITARAYVEDGNGKRTYSGTVYVEVNSNTSLPVVEIVNNNLNPDYVLFDENIYTYKLGIKKPDSYVLKIQPEKFAYTVYEKKDDGRIVVGRYGINDNFTVQVPKNCVKTYYAQLGYYDENGGFIELGGLGFTKYLFTIDTRKIITAPVLELSQNDEDYDYRRKNGEIVYVDSSVYRNADKDTLDYNVKGIEFYQIYYVDNNMRIFQYMVPSSSYRFHTKLEDGIAGMSTYVGRAYAVNSNGQVIYSDYSNALTVIRTPEIEVSDLNEGKVSVNIKNIDEYLEVASDLKYKVFNSLGTELTELVDLDEKSIINVDSTTKLYVRIYEESDETENTYSAKSNIVDVIVE